MVPVGESDEDSPTEAQLDDQITEHDDDEQPEQLSSQEAQQRASAAAAYGKAAQRAPRKPAAAPAPPEQPAEDESNDESEADQVQQDLTELAAKAELADEYLMLAQRTQADFENYRKRAARDAAQAQDRGVAKLAKELLPAVDNLERAVQAAEAFAAPADAPEDAAGSETAAAETQMVDGLKLVHAELLAALARAGIEPFSPVGEQFDPQHHEAVAQHRVDGAAPGTVIEVYQQGYRLGETVLRPARVLVAS